MVVREEEESEEEDIERADQREYRYAAGSKVKINSDSSSLVYQIVSA